MLRIGDNLTKIGYREKNKKSNLFYKFINDNEEKGTVFADLRGTLIVPIWEDTSPFTYYKDISFKKYFKELILLKRSGCLPRTTFFQDSEPESIHFKKIKKHLTMFLPS